MVRLRAASLALLLVGASPGVAPTAAAASPAPEVDELRMVPVQTTRSDGPGIRRWRGSWRRMPKAPIEGRTGAATGSGLNVHDERTSRGSAGGRLFIWSGRAADGRLLEDGALFDVQKQRWHTLPTAPLSPRTDAVVRYDWLAQRFVVWGGVGVDGRPLVDGAAYDFQERRWTMLPPSPLPATRSDLDGDLNGYFVIATDPDDGGPLVAVLDWTDEGIDPEYSGLDAERHMQWSWSEPQRPPLPAGERYEVVSEDGDIAMLISYRAHGHASAIELESGTADAGYRDPVRLPISAEGASGHRFERFAWFGLGAPTDGDAPEGDAPGPHGALAPVTQLHETWRLTSPGPPEVALEDELIVTPRHVIGPESLIAWDPTTARWLRIRPPKGGLRTDASAVWLNGMLLVWGGMASDGSVRGDGWTFSPRLPGRTVALPEHAVPLSDGCISRAVDPRGLRLDGAMDDPRVTWFQGSDTTVRVIWPPGYVARFRPDLEVIDPSGTVVAREGDRPGRRFDGTFNELALCLFRPATIRGTPRMRIWTGNDPDPDAEARSFEASAGLATQLLDGPSGETSEQDPLGGEPHEGT